MGSARGDRRDRSGEPRGTPRCRRVRAGRACDRRRPKRTATGGRSGCRARRPPRPRGRDEPRDGRPECAGGRRAYPHVRNRGPDDRVARLPGAAPAPGPAAAGPVPAGRCGGAQRGATPGRGGHPTRLGARSQDQRRDRRRAGDGRRSCRLGPRGRRRRSPPMPPPSQPAVAPSRSSDRPTSGSTPGCMRASRTRSSPGPARSSRS